MTISKLAFAFALTTFLAAVAAFACSGSDSQPVASSSPELSAQEISQRIPSDFGTARINSVRHANISGETLDDEMEGVEVGDDMFLKRGATRLLEYGNNFYTRTSDSSAWEKAGLSSLLALADFEFMGFSSESSGPTALATPGVARLPDDNIDGHQVFHLSGASDLTDASSVSDFLLTVPFVRIRSIDPSTVASIHGGVDVWIDMESFHYRRLKIDVEAVGADGQSVFDATETTTFSDIGESLELPGPLPSPE